MTDAIAKMLSFTGIMDSKPKHDLKKLEEEYKESLKRLDLGAVRLEDFQLMVTLGRGTFGRVRLTRHKLLEQRALALKIMKKSEIIRLKQTGEFWVSPLFSLSSNSHRYGDINYADRLILAYRTYQIGEEHFGAALPSVHRHNVCVLPG